METSLTRWVTVPWCPERARCFLVNSAMSVLNIHPVVSYRKHKINSIGSYTCVHIVHHSKSGSKDHLNVNVRFSVTFFNCDYSIQALLHDSLGYVQSTFFSTISTLYSLNLTWDKINELYQVFMRNSSSRVPSFWSCVSSTTRCWLFVIGNQIA